MPMPLDAAEAPLPDTPPGPEKPAAGPAATPEPALKPTSPPLPGEQEFEAISALLEQALGDRYLVLRTLAVGGMATIVQLRHRRHGGMFVAKILHAHLCDRQELVAAFSDEARHMAQLASHPNVIPVVDLGEAGAQPYMILPFVAGQDLDQLLRRHGKLGRDEACLLLAQLGSLLMLAETLGIVHCDLTPGNIRLDPFGNYRVYDFGLSRASATTVTGSLHRAGTPAYNSPEQLRGEPLDSRADLYSLGIIFFEALTGKPLYEAPTLVDLAEKHLRGEWTVPPELEADAPIAALLRSLLAVDRETRMASPFELTGALSAMGFELPSFDASLLPKELTVPKARRRRLEAL